jgi:hypothetical protein
VILLDRVLSLPSDISGLKSGHDRILFLQTGGGKIDVSLENPGWCWRRKHRGNEATKSPLRSHQFFAAGVLIPPRASFTRMSLMAQRSFGSGMDHNSWQTV